MNLKHAMCGSGQYFFSDCKNWRQIYRHSNLMAWFNSNHLVEGYVDCWDLYWVLVVRLKVIEPKTFKKEVGQFPSGVVISSNQLKEFMKKFPYEMLMKKYKQNKKDGLYGKA